MVATFRKVATIRKTPSMIRANEPPRTSISCETNQKKLFVQRSGNAFQLSQLNQSNCQGINA